MVLEDSDEDFDTVREAMRSGGFPNEIHRTSTGEDCLSFLRTSAIIPALLLLDLSTPGLDGRETLREIKADPALRQQPVVVLTTSSSPRDLAFCYGAGAHAYHAKPVRYPEHLALLVGIFEYWLRLVVPPGAKRMAP